MQLNVHEKRIVNVLYYAHKPLSTSDIAKHSELSWQTTKKYLEELHKHGFLNNGKKGNAVFWWIKVE